jgi:hypothetical protein
MDSGTSNDPVTIYKVIDEWLQESGLCKHFYIFPMSERAYMICISCDASKLPVCFFDDIRVTDLYEDINLCDIELFSKMQKIIINGHNKLSSHRI